MLEGIEHIYKRKEHILILNPNLRGIITQGERSERIIKIERNNNKENANVKETDIKKEIEQYDMKNNKTDINNLIPTKEKVNIISDNDYDSFKLFSQAKPYIIRIKELEKKINEKETEILVLKRKRHSFDSLKISSCINELSFQSCKESFIEKMNYYKKLSFKRERELVRLEKKNEELENKLNDEIVKSSVLKEIAEEEQSKLRRSREKFQIAQSKNTILIKEIKKRNISIGKYKSYSIDKNCFNLPSYRQTEIKKNNSQNKLYLLKPKLNDNNLLTKMIQTERSKCRIFPSRQNSQSSIDQIKMDNIVIDIKQNDTLSTITRNNYFLHSSQSM